MKKLLTTIIAIVMVATLTISTFAVSMACMDLERMIENANENDLIPVYVFLQPAVIWEEVYRQLFGQDPGNGEEGNEQEDSARAREVREIVSRENRAKGQNFIDSLDPPREALFFYYNQPQHITIIVEATLDEILGFAEIDSVFAMAYFDVNTSPSWRGPPGFLYDANGNGNNGNLAPCPDCNEYPCECEPEPTSPPTTEPPATTPSPDPNPPTGVILSIVPILLAGGVVLMSRKRK